MHIQVTKIVETGIKNNSWQWVVAIIDKPMLNLSKIIENQDII